jgi:hypothetical protein
MTDGDHAQKARLEVRMPGYDAERVLAPLMGEPGLACQNSKV